ncbi:G-protein coupled receptor Mth2-like [Polyergus mexicanus]|uniref:G-protein coupled receptor Mth2-like n=1 Tax=Polyergus mexicanus TaxID=615972 RepID=UPI0038B58A42
MYKKNLALWYYMFPLIASSSMLWPSSMSDERKKNYSIVRYQLGANIVRNDDEEDLIRYNLYENFTEDNNIMQYAYRINFTSNNSENKDLIQYKEHDNDSQTSVQSSINSTGASRKKNLISREIHGNLKGIIDENAFTSYDFFKNFDRYNIIADKMCDNIVCIRLCCPFGNRLVNGKCIAQQDKFIFLEMMYGYINDSLQNESKQAGELFLLIAHDPCQKSGHYLLSFSRNKFLVNGSLYLPYYNAIIEPTSYCVAAMDYNIFGVNVCFDIMKEIMNKNVNYDKNTMNPEALKVNWMYIKNKNSSTSHDLIKNSYRDNKNSIILNEMCDNITCIRLCCPFGNRLVNGTCIAGQGNFIFLPKIYGYFNDLLRNENKNIDNLFLLVVHDPCQKTGQPFSIPFSNKITFFVNGSLYLHSYNTIVKSISYCLANVAGYRFNVNICFEIKKKIIEDSKSVSVPIQTSTIVYICGFLATLLFSLVMFIVYSIVPELRNIHSFILRGYSGSIVIVNTVELVKIFIGEHVIEDFICIAYAFVKYYFYLARWFWLSVMSIDIWRIFRKLRSLQRNANEMKQQERKKLIQYSAYGWGGPFMLAIIYAIMEFVPGVPENFRPTFGNDECWLSGKAYFFYYLGVVIICIIIIITLCIFTAQKITHYEKDIAHYLKDSESRRYKDNKQWFGLYLEAIKVLFIIICVKHFMYATQSFCDESSMTSSSLRYMYAVLDVIEQFCIFIIFVWKEKIRKLLLKQFGCQGHGLFSVGQRIITSFNSCTTTRETTSL